MDLGLSDKLVLVTGSTQGIGKAMARAFLAEGARVVVNGRREARVEETVRELQSLGTVHGVAADVASSGDAQRLWREVERLGPLDVLVGNAAVFEVKAFEDITDEEWLRYFDVNVVANVRLARHFLPRMLERDRGRVILVGSEAGVKPVPAMLHYSVTKSALLGLSRGLAELTKGSSVTVNCLLPGPTLSEGVQGFLDGAARAQGVDRETLVANYFRENEPGSLLQRFATPEEVAPAALFLASERASAVNGTALRAEGGIVRHIT